jgi:hypothetical protein
MLDYLRTMLNVQKAKMDERGASAVEYGLLIAGIAALIIVPVPLGRRRPRLVFNPPGGGGRPQNAPRPLPCVLQDDFYHR